MLRNLEFFGRRARCEVNALIPRAHVFINVSLRERLPSGFLNSWRCQITVGTVQVKEDGVLSLECVAIFAVNDVEVENSVPCSPLDPALREHYAMRASHMPRAGTHWATLRARDNNQFLHRASG
jgi:hypothetical protein